MPDIQTPERIHELPISVIKNMIVLSTSGFGLVVALAWNQFIQKLVESYITPYLGKNGGVISLLIYAVVITLVAVIVTMQLTRIQRKLESFEEMIKERRH